MATENDEIIIIANISDNTVNYKFFPYYANVAMIQTNNDYTGISAPEFELENMGLNNAKNIISFAVEKRQYLKVNTVDEVIATQSAFYFNNENKQLLIHFENHKPYYYFKENSIEIGFVLGFFNCASETTGEFNGQQYEPRLLNTGLITDTKDDILEGRQKLQSAKITIDNYDLKYKNFNIGPGVKKRNGNYCQLLFWTGPKAINAVYSEFEVYYQGVIERINEGKTIDIELRDLRSTLTVKTPDRYLDTAEYDQIKDDTQQYILPEAWGKCYNVPLLCLNENANDTGSADFYQFLICDTSFKTIATDSIIKIYIENKYRNISATVKYNTAQQFAYIEIAKAEFVNYTTTSTTYENMDQVSADIEGYIKGADFIEADGSTTTTPNDLIENGLSIIRQILLKNYGYTYTALYYDLITWEYYETGATAYNVGVYFNKQQTTQKQIQVIQKSLIGQFIWNENLKFTFNNNDFISYFTEIEKHKFYPINYFPNFDQDSTETLAQIRIGIKQNNKTTDAENKYNWIIDNSNIDSALVNYNSTAEKDILTILTDPTQGAEFGTRYIADTGISNDTFNITTNWDLYGIKAGQWVRVQADFNDIILIGWCRCQVIQVKPDLKNKLIKLKLRIFGYYKYITQNGQQITQKGQYITTSEIL